ncbi:MULTISPECIES: tryptophan halogenase family protein [unclassified Sphingomonas]|uniref:tryptophan halogenase family protein n=1 Tax=unclassified Sphingomonas TaxID=196159 RepID=UPI0006FDD103|nr:MULTISPECIES: tryptophan halogenase family protein [unclassified Sphingomonas]KQM63178.1 tryptophan halogenase [Sphingomonas sp. Leaf16]KQN14974.1 tryptophan halogenase [Sphingomonas sp. Leaf29]KQN20552.1 tryptophan halogenase [Sphingomonas sp. Leaf32]
MTPLKRILIAGGGSAGWMTAAMFARLFKGRYAITLVESDAIGTVGVGEATIPAIKKFNDLLGLDEDEFLRRTQGSFKLGIRFDDWSRIGSSYVHGFGVIGRDLEWLRCHQYWTKLHREGRGGPLDDYSINTVAAVADRFMRPRADMPDSPIGQIAYAFHFDAGLYAAYLADYARTRGVERREGEIVAVGQDADSGFLRSVTLADGSVIEADLFVDCSGFRGLLIEQALAAGYEAWSHWLPCDRAVAVPSARAADFPPYTRSTARPAGWQWRIPLQHRTGNGHVYASRHMDDATAEALLLDHLEEPAIGTPRRLSFVPGKRRRAWVRNCVAIGLSAGFLEPLESTGLHLIQSAILRLVRLMPDAAFDPATIAEYNRQTDFEMERIRDFIILHYKATQRDDTPFWRHVRTMDVPDTLARKMALFAANGRIFREDDELFAEESWIQVLIGQGIVPMAPDPLVDVTPAAEIDRHLADVRGVIAKCVARMPAHDAFVAHHCAAPPPDAAR